MKNWMKAALTLASVAAIAAGGATPASAANNASHKWD